MQSLKRCCTGEAQKLANGSSTQIHPLETQLGAPDYCPGRPCWPFDKVAGLLLIFSIIFWDLGLLFLGSIAGKYWGNVYQESIAALCYLCDFRSLQYFSFQYR